MHVVVVGGGIAGLAAAWFLRAPGVRVTVLEGRARVGGALALGEVAGIGVDLGAEALLARRPEAVELVRAVGLGGDLVHPRTTAAGVWSAGAVRPLPAAQVMGVPLDPSAALGILSAAGVARAAAEAGLPLSRHDADVSVGAFVRARLGDEVLERLVDPLLGGVYAGRADELSLFATLPQLAPAATEPASLRAVAVRVHRAGDPSRPVFAGISGGVGRLPGRLAEVCGAQVRTGVIVRELHPTPTGWRLVTGPTTGPAAIEADAVVLAVPAGPAARLLAGAVPPAAAELAGIEYASMAIVTLALAGCDGPAGGSGFLVPAIDGRLIKAVTRSSSKWAWTARAAGPGTVVLRASIGRIGETADLACTDAELIDRVRAEVAEATGLTGTPIDAVVTRWGGALPQYRVGHLERVQRIRRAVAAAPGLAVCGAAYDGVGVAACIASARRAVEELQAEWRREVRHE